MKRSIVDYKKLDRDVAALLIDLYPHGYGDEDIIILRKPSGEVIEAVEVKTEDTIYLVKISKSISNFISNFEETIEKELESKSEKQTLTTEAIAPELENASDLEVDAEEL